MRILFYFSIFLCIYNSFSSLSHDFSYYKNGEDWTDGDCVNGTNQSPININTRKVTQINETHHLKMSIIFNPNVTTETENVGTTIKNFGNWSTISYEKEEVTYFFDAAQFHFHSPSEHTINGDYYDAEMHIVHLLRSDNYSKEIERKISVLGVFLIVNATDEDTALLEYDPAKSGEFELNLNEKFAEKILKYDTFFMYDGGLTTPGCEEEVNWFVVDQPVSISQTLMDKFKNAWPKNSSFAGGKGNNRITKPLNGRTVYKGQIFGNILLVNVFLFLLILAIIF